MEEILDPELPICDPHHHLWDRPGHRYLIDEYTADTRSGHNVRCSVEIECRLAYRSDGPETFRSVGETEYVAASDKDALIAGMVVFADLRIPEIEDLLAAHREVSGGRLRGVRHSIAWDAVIPATRAMPANLLDDPAFDKGLDVLGRQGLTFDAWLYHPQLPGLAELARRHLDVQIVLEHFGTPLGIGPYSGRRDEVYDLWRSSMKDLSACPNVAVKLGGIGQARLGVEWPNDSREVTTSDDIARVWGEPLRWCIEQFGAARCMFESNFPVDGEVFNYVAVWNAYKRMTADASADERSALFHDSAVRVYQL